MTASAVAAVVSGQPNLSVAQRPLLVDVGRRPVFDSYQAFKAELAAIAATEDEAARTKRFDRVWREVTSAGQVPFVAGNQFVMLYRGEAKSVAFAGDHTGWQPSAAATRLAGTDLWYFEGTLPEDARVDYKVVVDGAWMLDPANPLEVWSGMGPNSELRMPAYQFPRESVRRVGVRRGTLSSEIRLASKQLGYDVQYRVYTPAGYEEQRLSDLPVVYVTDGHEYAADHLGALVAVLDNLIDDGSLRPAIAVFIDPRDPDNLSINRRIAEYNMNPQFAAFVAKELVPAVDGKYRTAQRAEGRVILGTSMGGLNAAYFGATRGDTFGKLAIQSPAFSVNPRIYALYEQPPAVPLTIIMTAGTLHDGEGGRRMKGILAKYRYDFTFTEVNEGHSWGNWRGQLAEMLVALVGESDGGATNDATDLAGVELKSSGWRSCVDGENSSCRNRGERRQLSGRRCLGGRPLPRLICLELIHSR